MGALRKTMVYLGLADGEDHYPLDEQQYRHPEPTQRKTEESSVETENHHAQAPAQQREQNEASEYRAPVTPIKRAGASREDVPSLRQITTIHPRSYNDAKLIGESFRDGIPVIMNVTDMGEADAKRLVDFSAGLVFGMHGAIERVTNKVFLLSPSYIEVLGDDKKVSESQSSFFNQS